VWNKLVELKWLNLFHQFITVPNYIAIYKLKLGVSLLYLMINDQ